VAIRGRLERQVIGVGISLVKERRGHVVREWRGFKIATVRMSEIAESGRGFSNRKLHEVLVLLSISHSTNHCYHLPWFSRCSGILGRDGWMGSELDLTLSESPIQVQGDSTRTTPTQMQ